MGTTDQVTSTVENAEILHALRMLRIVWQGQSGSVFFSYRNGQWYERPVDWDGQKMLSWTYNDHRADDGDIYFCPLVFNYPQRKAEFALPTHVLWADLDAADPRRVRLRPSCAWETSGGDIPHYQALWFLDQQISAQEAAALSKRIAYAEPGCDRSGWDVTQVLRLPGTLNHKYDPPQPVRFLWATIHTYTLAEVEAAYPQEQPYKVPPHLAWTGARSLSDIPLYSDAELEPKRALLPVGLQYELERPYDGRDRSAWLFRTAGTLLDFKVPPAVIVELLRRAPMNKFAGRADETTRLRETVAQAMSRRTTVDYSHD